MICQFAQQLESLTLAKFDNCELPNTIVLPKLKYLAMILLRSEHYVSNVQQWVQRCPTLETIRLTFELNNNRDCNALAQALLNVPNIEVCCLNNSLDAKPFGDKLRHFTVHSIDYGDVISIVHPKLQLLHIEKMHNMKFEQMAHLKKLA